jgi:GT2 family glycosyltransferase
VLESHLAGPSGAHSGAGVAQACLAMDRPQVAGKFFSAGGRKLYLKGVTYGPFAPNNGNGTCGSRETVASDFRLMVQHGINTVRLYAVPPRWLLDEAQACNLRVLIGLPWEQHVTFLDDGPTRRGIAGRVRAGVRACAGHPAVLGYAIGNEIPSPIVRWHGRGPVERFLAGLRGVVLEEDPQALVTYVNYPTTEYLQLPFLDFVCFNVYLEAKDRLTAYLARLQNIAGERPLVMAEIGLDSLRHGEAAQAQALDWQIRSAFASGCAGAFLFSWTDEWHRVGCDIEDWAFGLTTRSRQPKPALEVVQRAFADAPLSPQASRPRISVVVCVYNGARTLRHCLEGLSRLAYPDYEVIVVNDGSTDDTAAIAASFDVKLINQENGGLSNARNVGLRAASGDIIAYIDDDAWPDPDWLDHLAHTFMATDHAGVGGPNIPPRGDGPIADCVASAPGGPSHVLLNDHEVEHIPGCNMAFRRAALEAIGGFDARFRIAGDDVDLCWRLLERGLTLGFNPAAVVWHHRRSTVRAYLKQQLNYGRAEAMLEAKWPEKYNRVGHVRWKGRVYGTGPPLPLFGRRHRIYHGVWGTGLFQSMYARHHGILESLTLMPEWYLLVGLLLVLAVSSIGSAAAWFCAAAFAAAAGIPLVQAATNAARAMPSEPLGGRFGRWRWRLRLMYLHIAQPAVRLAGRLSYGLTPWRRRGAARPVLPRPCAVVRWSEQWAPPEAWLRSLQGAIRDTGGLVAQGSDYDRWDLEVRGGMLGGARILMAVEEHDNGRQLVRFRAWPRPIGACTGLLLILAGLAGAAGALGAWGLCAALGAGALALGAGALLDCRVAMGAFLAAARAKDT